MVLPFAASAASYLHLPLTQFALAGASVASLLALRRAAAGPKCPDRRRLDNKTFILVGCWSGPGLSLVTDLAWAGAQVILLHPDPLDPAVVQLLILLRHSTANERIYAEECDMLDVGSIRRFARKWEKEGRGGMVNELEARIEGVVFCDGDGSGFTGGGIGERTEVVSGLGKDQALVDEGVEKQHMALLLSRHAFLQLMLPSLLKSSATSPVRIISQLSPFYAAAIPSLLPPSPSPPNLNLDVSPSPSSPWLHQARLALASLLLLRDLQRRSDLGPSRQNGGAGLVVLFASGGFTRQWARRTLRAEWYAPGFSWAGYALWWVLLPVVWVFLRSAEEASRELVRCVMGEVREVGVVEGAETSQAKTESDEAAEGGKKVRRGEGEDKPRTRLRRGALYRNGTEIRCVSSPAFPAAALPADCDGTCRIAALEAMPASLPSELWERESARVEKLVAVAVKRDGAGAGRTAMEEHLERAKEGKAT